MGEEKFVCAYRALDNPSESDDEDKVEPLCEVMGEDISYLGLIHQLLVQDSMHAANEGSEGGLLTKGLRGVCQTVTHGISLS